MRPRTASRLLLPLLLAAGLLPACSRPELALGEGCERNSDCDSPLVCAIGRCRRQCFESRDCAAGLLCLTVDKDFGGACQLPDEATCALNSDCTGALVCQMGTCETECADARDCVPGATCEAIAGGDLACNEAEPELCIYNSDCDAGLVCATDQICREECIEDRDCDFPRVCDPAMQLCVLEPCDAGGACGEGRGCEMGFCQPISVGTGTP